MPSHLQAQGIEPTQLHLGTHTPKSGLAAPLSTSTDALIAYLEFINDMGGVHGRELVLHQQDSGYLPAVADRAVRQLVFENQVFGIIHGIGTHPHRSIQGKLAQWGVPDLMIDSPHSDWHTEGSSSGFLPSSKLEGQIFAAYLGRQFPGQRVGVWHFGSESTEEFLASLTRSLYTRRMQVRPIVASTTSPQTAMEQFSQEGVRVVVIDAPPRTAAEMLAGAYLSGSKLPMVLTESLADQAWLDGLRSQYLENVVLAKALPLARDAAHPGLNLHQMILNEYLPGVVPSRRTILGQAVGEVLVQALVASGRELSRNRVVAQTQSVSQTWPGVVPPQALEGEFRGSVIRKLRFHRWEQGTWVADSPWLAAGE